VGRIHDGAVKLTHYFPSLFLAGLFAIAMLFLFNLKIGMIALFALTCYLLLICFGAMTTTGSLVVGMLSMPAAVVQLTGYGLGFLKEKLGF
jgi:hypothetical protein